LKASNVKNHGPTWPKQEEILIFGNAYRSCLLGRARHEA